MQRTETFLPSALSTVLAAGLMLSTLAVGCDEDKRTMTNASTIGQRDPAGQYETATFAAGCFWGVEATFRGVEGVVETSVGYTGGHAENPTYRQVCSGTTGHAEAVRVVYDPTVVSYEQLLDVFWSCHDPTQHNRQGPDIGEQYRSAIFVHDDRQEEIARQSLRTQQDKRNGRIATNIEQAETYWRAEEYHQQYVEKTGRGACAR